MRQVDKRVCAKCRTVLAELVDLQVLPLKFACSIPAILATELYAAVILQILMSTSLQKASFSACGRPVGGAHTVKNEWCDQLRQ